MFLSLSPSLPLSLKINKIFKKKGIKKRFSKCGLHALTQFPQLLLPPHSSLTSAPHSLSEPLLGPHSTPPLSRLWPCLLVSCTPGPHLPLLRLPLRWEVPHVPLRCWSPSGHYLYLLTLHPLPGQPYTLPWLCDIPWPTNLKSLSSEAPLWVPGVPSLTSPSEYPIGISPSACTRWNPAYSPSPFFLLTLPSFSKPRKKPHSLRTLPTAPLPDRLSTFPPPALPPEQLRPITSLDLWLLLERGWRCLHSAPTLHPQPQQFRRLSSLFQAQGGNCSLYC